MSVAAGPDIVEDGLVFCVDWSNPRCYQGAVGSEDWNDISLNPVATNGHHQSSGSGPTYVSSGSLAYFNYERDNTERHRTTEAGGASLLSQMGHSGSGISVFPYTLEAFFRLSSLPTGAGSESFTLIGNTISGAGFGLMVRKNNNNNVHTQIGFRGRGSHAETTTEIVTNTWYHTVMARDNGDDGSANIKMFLNGELKRNLTNGRADVNYPSNTVVAIGNGGSGTTGAMDGDIAVVRVYNKQLTLAEVQQNYNAIKSRFGL